ncbi:hypothetical protein KBZ10_03915 [Streptomyces sp. F63]|uniref:hypothetical protein n=1 Tax=Streptomyces sp. F63 TaxID=2824887 RepID=UPI001B37D427|nr:hypothetical protein [Streptomyces sp. F63]MBQ0983682.1 hypothetical protein [Streptomyces sp. F63]
MALINEFESRPSDAQSVHGPVSCGYRVFTIEGQRILQLDTYGSPERKIQGKTSQSIQLDAKSAQDLINILKESFPNIKG